MCSIEGTSKDILTLATLSIANTLNQGDIFWIFTSRESGLDELDIWVNVSDEVDLQPILSAVSPISFRNSYRM